MDNRWIDTEIRWIGLPSWQSVAGEENVTWMGKKSSAAVAAALNSMVEEAEEPSTKGTCHVSVLARRSYAASPDSVER